MTTAEEAQRPRFSVVVPAYQASETLAETLDAILAQSYHNWECVVVDDGSTDATLQIASGYAERDHRIRAVHQDNRGTAGAYNAGVSAAIGDFIVICSADDILLPEHLARMSSFIEAETGYDIYSTNGYFWVPGESQALCYGAGQGEVVHSLELRDLIHRCFYGVGAAYRRDLFAAVGGYRVGVYGEDYDFWLRALAGGARHRYLPEALSLHRISAQQKSAQLDTVFRSDIRLVSDLRREFTLSAVDSLAVDESICERERLIAQLHQPWGLYRNALRPAAKRIAHRLLGGARTRHLYRVLRSTVGRALRTDQPP
ncbi:MAG: glycosyltransferase family A protein [Candidatus Limnocylindria bacterium]